MCKRVKAQEKQEIEIEEGRAKSARETKSMYSRVCECGIQALCSDMDEFTI